jgi:hypothetical protein
MELGDLDGARQRMLEIEEEISQTQEGFGFATWAVILVRILCEIPEESTLEKAEDLIARVRAQTSGFHARVRSQASWLARVALLRGRLGEAVELFQTGLPPTTALFRIAHAAPYIQALLGLGRASEARLVAEQVLDKLTTFSGAGCLEVEARLAVTDAFEATGDHDRARTELTETLRQVQLRLDDIADPFWKNSYLTRNRYVARTLALGRAWDLPALPRTDA